MDAHRSARTARVGFPGHDREGAELARAVLRRLRASEKLADHVAALCLHHLRLGFLVHERAARPARGLALPARRPSRTRADVTVFTVADRLATRGRNAEPAIAAHLELARELLGPALARRADGRAARRSCAATSWRASSGIRPGPRLGELLAQLEEDRFAGEIATREDAIRRARELAGAAERADRLQADLGAAPRPCRSRGWPRRRAGEW